MQNLKDIKDFADVLEFSVDFGGIFKKDNRARTSLNKTLETNYRAVFRGEKVYKEQWKSGSIDWSGEDFYAITEKGRVLYFSNSEWGGVNDN